MKNINNNLQELTKESTKNTLAKKFFGSRMPVGDSVKLEQRSTYILPTRAGLLMFGVIFLMMVGATNYQNNLAFLLTFMIVSIGLVSILFTFRNLQGLSFKKGAVESVFAGELLQLVVHSTSQSNQNHMTIGVGFNKNDIYYLDINSNNAGQFYLPIKSQERGWLHLPRLMATSSFPFGLLRVWTWFQFETPVLIYPKPIEPPFETGQGEADEGENNKMAGSDDLYGLKSYQSGDPITRIDWKALARERGLFSKEFVAYQSQDLVFSWNDFSTTEDELKLSYLSYLVNEASKKNYQYSLVLPQVKLEKNSGVNHRQQCLQALAMYGLNRGNDL